MGKYGIEIYLDDFLFPLAPSSFGKDYKKNYETEDMLHLGERDFLFKLTKLKEFSLDIYIPVTGLYINHYDISPFTVEDILKEKVEGDEPNRLIIPGLNFNELVNFYKFSPVNDADNQKLTKATLSFREFKPVDIPELAPVEEVQTPQLNKERKDERKTGQSYRIRSGDTLWGLAEKHYGDGSQYNKIAEANKDLIKNPHKINAGWEIIIP